MFFVVICHKLQCFGLLTDHLFEVAVEVSFTHSLEDSWDSLARLLLLSVKTLVCRFKRENFYLNT